MNANVYVNLFYNMAVSKPHKNIRGKEYYAQAVEESKQRDNPVQTPVFRLRLFARRMQSEGFCKSEAEFERQCNLSRYYIKRNMLNNKGNIGTEMLLRIIRVYPQLNLA